MKSVVQHLRRLINARRFRVRFYRRAAFTTPTRVTIGTRRVNLAFPDESGILNDFLVCFINDEYGLKETESTVQTIVDIGSNAGFYSMAARSWFPSATIHAYEPNPRILDYLMKNATNAAFEVYPEAVGAIEGRVSVLDTSDSNLARTSAVIGEQNGIRQVSLAKVIERMGGQIDLAKIDCEGAEWNLFTDKAAWSKINSIRMEYHLWNEHKYSEVHDSLDNLGFRIYHHNPCGEYGTVWAQKITD